MPLVKIFYVKIETRSNSEAERLNYYNKKYSKGKGKKNIC